MPKIKATQKLPQKFNPSINSEVSSVSSESDLYAFLTSPKKDQIEAALVFLVNYEMNTLHKVVTDEIQTILIEMIAHEQDDISVLSIGVLRNYIQEIIDSSVTIEDDTSEVQGKVDSFNWNGLISSLLQRKEMPHILEWLKIVRVICCADINSLKSVTQDSKDKFTEILNRVATVISNKDVLGTVYSGDGGVTIWEALYIFFVWTDQNTQSCQLMLGNAEVIAALQHFITGPLPPQRIPSRKFFGMKYKPMTEEEMEQAEMEDIDDNGNIVEKNQGLDLEVVQHTDYPSYIKIISHAILFNIRNYSGERDSQEFLNGVGNFFNAFASSLVATQPDQHLEELIKLISSIHMSHSESDKIRDDWRLSVEGQKLGMELLTNLISNIAYDLQGPKVTEWSSDDDSSSSRYLYDFLSQMNVLSGIHAFVSSILQPPTSLVASKAEFVADQWNLIMELLIGTLYCLTNILIASHSSSLKGSLQLLQSTSNQLFSFLRADRVSNTHILTALLEAATLFQWTLLRKVDDIDIAFANAEYVLSLTNHDSSEVRRNAIGILGEFGDREHTLEQNNALAEVFLTKISDKNVLVSAECLCAIFKVYGDEYYDNIVKKNQMINRLTVFKNQIFLARFKAQLERLEAEDKDFVEEAINNLNAFIAYKKQHM